MNPDDGKGDGEIRYPSALRIFVVTILSIIAMEAVLTNILHHFRDISPLLEPIIHTALLTIGISPVIYFTMYRPFTRYIKAHQRSEDARLIGELHLKNAREYFTAVTSHELYTPLTKLQMIKVLLGNLRPLISREDRLDEITGYMQDVYTEFERIVTATTIFTTLNSPAPKEEFKPVYLYYDFMECMDHASNAMTREKRKLTLDIKAGEMPKETVVRGDRGMLVRCIQEIMSNAIKYTPDGGKIFVQAGVESGQVVIEVRDEGIGIPEERKALAFEPFFSFENPSYHSTGPYKFKGGGLGLGLTISLMILEYHGGKLSLESAGENRGATATIRLPLA